MGRQVFDAMLGCATLFNLQFKTMSQRPQIEKYKNLGDQCGFTNGFFDIVDRSRDIGLFNLAVILGSRDEYDRYRSGSFIFI